MDFVSTLSSETQLSSRVDLLINLLALFSTTLLGVFGVLAVILGFIIWKQKDLLDKAEKDVARIDELKRNVEKAWELFDEMMVAAKQSYELLRTKADEVDSELSEAKRKVSEKSQEANKSIEEVAKKLSSLLNEIERGRNSLATVAPPSLRSYSHQAVKNAQEILRSETMEAMKRRLDDYPKPQFTDNP